MKKLMFTIVFLCSLQSINAQKDSIQTNQQEDYFDSISFNIGAGIFIPKGNLKTYFGTSPLLEASFNLPLSKEKSLDFVMQFAIPNQRQEFRFIRNIDTLNAKSNLMFNAFAKFNKPIIKKRNKKLNIYFGLGISTITTDARNPFYSGQEGENKYEFISSILIAPGIDYIYYFKRKGHLSIGMNYHYSPYKTEGALRENIGSSGIIPRISFQF